MEASEIPLRLIRAARDISRLPPELHEAILSQLGFADIVRLSLAPTASHVLNDSIRLSDEWKWLFYNNLDSIKASWAALDAICDLWCQRSWLAMWSARNSIQKGAKGMFAYTSKELKERYYSDRWEALDEETTSKAITNDLRITVMAVFGTFIGSEKGPSNWRYGDYFSLHHWRNHRSLRITDRRSIALFLSDAFRNSIVSGDPLPSEWDAQETWEQRMANAPTEEMVTLCAESLASRVWSFDEILTVLPVLRQALDMINLAQSTELEAMADLHQRYSETLKEPRAPNTPRRNSKHIIKQLRLEAAQARERPAFISHRTHAEPDLSIAPATVLVGNYRFRHPHLPLIPYNWCIHLFSSINERYPIQNATNDSPYPPALLSQLQVALEGFEYTHSHGSGRDSPRTPRISTDGSYYLLHLSMMYGCPRPSAEIRWLAAFAECVSWMAKAFPQKAAISKRVCHDPEPAANTLRFKSSVMSAEDYVALVQTASPREIAKHLLLDSEVCDNKGGRFTGTLPSLLSLYLPPFQSQKGRAIAARLMPTGAVSSANASRLLYDSIVSKITYCIQYPRLGEPTGDIFRRLIPKSAAEEPDESPNPASKASSATASLTEEQMLQASIRIAERLRDASEDEKDIQTAATALAALHDLVKLQALQKAKSKVESKDWDTIDKEYRESLSRTYSVQPPQRSILRCYICRFTCTDQHKLFPAMCIPCGDFNLAGSAFVKTPGIIIPDHRKIAVITGGRVNLGFHLALHFLTQGFRVIVTTRYPQDAVQRYRQHFIRKGRDAARTTCNLRIIGADFRTSVDVFNAVCQIKELVTCPDRGFTWGSLCGIYFLINNAAQTLTDSIAKERLGIEREASLAQQGNSFEVLPVQHNYTPRVRGGTLGAVEGSAPLMPLIDGGGKQDVLPVVGDCSPSSWAQRLSDIPYEDFISAHSVNTFTPLMLIRELAPLMSTGRDGLQGHIVNVSSREGIFEARRGNTAKSGRHVHTNMSKAGLNMITETEAETLWKEKRIAVNTVDPGYMSAAPECQNLFNGERPISWEDGAARVLWPIYQMEAKYKEREKNKEYNKYWGRFFKHYGAVRVEPRFGRG